MDLQTLLSQLSPVDDREDIKQTGIKCRVAANTGRKNTPETIARMSQTKLGKHCTESHRANLSAALTGKPRPDIAALLLGKPLGEEAKKKMAATNVKRGLEKRLERFAPNWETLLAAYTSPVMQPAGNRINWQATSIKYGLPVSEIAAFINMQKAGKLS